MFDEHYYMYQESDYTTWSLNEAKHFHVRRTSWGIHIIALSTEQHLVAVVIFCRSFLSKIELFLFSERHCTLSKDLCNVHVYTHTLNVTFLLLSVLIVANIRHSQTNCFKQNPHWLPHPIKEIEQPHIFHFFFNNLMTTKHETSNYSHYSYVTMHSAPYKLKLYKSLSYD